MRRFELHRDEDVSGVSGTGKVAEGVVFSDGTVGMRWTTEWPTSVVFHDRGVEALEHVHGHAGRTRIIWLDDVKDVDLYAGCLRYLDALDDEGPIGESWQSDELKDLIRKVRNRINGSLGTEAQI